jgi:SAM-dependent methyltransferase
MPILIIALVSAVTLGLEILLTNVFSIALFSSHGAVAIALAMLGVAAGGAIGFLEGELDPERWRHRCFYLLVLLAVSVAGSIWGLLQIEFVPSSVTYWRYFDSKEFLSSGKLYYAIPIAFLPFLISGYLQVGIFKAGAARFGVLYGADLVGATVGAVVFQLLLYPLGLVGVAITMSAVLLVPVLISIVAERRLAGGLALLAAVGLLGYLGTSPTFRVQYCAGQSTWMGPTGRLVEEIWTPLARVALLEREDGTQSYVVNNSYAAYAPYTEETVEQYSRELFRVPVQAKSGGEVLVVASGAGPGVVLAKHFGARSIQAVEIADGIVHHIVRERRDDPGNPYLLDGVDWHVADARSFVMRQETDYDLILLRTVEGFSATGQLASAWSTNFITSQEAVREYLDHLKDDGVFAFATAAYPGAPNDWLGKDPLSHPITRVRLRSLTAGLLLAGSEDPGSQLVVFKHANWFVYLAKPTPFSDAELARYLSIAAELPSSRLRGGGPEVFVELAYPDVAGRLVLPETVHAAPELAAAIDVLVAETRPVGFSALPTALDPVDAHPLSDDRPYKYKSGLLDFSGEGFEFILGDSYRKLVSIVGLLAMVFVALPFVLKRRAGSGEALKIDPRLAQIAVLTGFGFMFVEMASMFRFQLYLHHPTIAMVVVLSSMILGAGLGSMHSTGAPRTTHSVARYCGASALLGLVVFGAPLVLHSTLLALPLGVTVVLLFAVFGALGFLLGHVVPLSIATFAGNESRVVAWTWAVTVTFSVFGTILSAILFRSAGVSVVAALGLASYALLWLLLRGAVAEGGVVDETVA